jgi:hypothetical protein
LVALVAHGGIVGGTGIKVHSGAVVVVRVIGEVKRLH